MVACTDMSDPAPKRGGMPTAPPLSDDDAQAAELFAAEVMRALREHESEQLLHESVAAMALEDLVEGGGGHDDGGTAFHVRGGGGGASQSSLSTTGQLEQLLRSSTFDLPTYQHFSSPVSLPLRGYGGVQTGSPEPLSLAGAGAVAAASRGAGIAGGAALEPGTPLALGGGGGDDDYGSAAGTPARGTPSSAASANAAAPLRQMRLTAQDTISPAATGGGSRVNRADVDAAGDSPLLGGAAAPSPASALDASGGALSLGGGRMPADPSVLLPPPPPLIVVHYAGEEYHVPSYFGVVEPHVYRSCFPSPEHYPFLARLRVRTIVNLLDKFPDEYAAFVAAHGIAYVHLPVKGNKLHCEEMDRGKARQALALLVDTAYHPILVHCRSGKHRTGALVGCLRMLQRWPLGDACEEYIAFCQHKQREVDKQCIERFDPRTLRAMLPPPERMPPWLPPDCADHPSALTEAITRGLLRASDAEYGLAPLPPGVVTKPGHPDEVISPVLAHSSFIRASYRATASVGRAVGLSMGLGLRAAAAAVAAAAASVVSGGGAGADGGSGVPGSSGSLLNSIRADAAAGGNNGGGSVSPRASGAGASGGSPRAARRNSLGAPISYGSSADSSAVGTPSAAALAPLPLLPSSPRSRLASVGGAGSPVLVAGSGVALTAPLPPLDAALPPLPPVMPLLRRSASAPLPDEVPLSQLARTAEEPPLSPTSDDSGAHGGERLSSIMRTPPRDGNGAGGHGHHHHGASSTLHHQQHQQQQQQQPHHHLHHPSILHIDDNDSRRESRLSSFDDSYPASTAHASPDAFASAAAAAAQYRAAGGSGGRAGGTATILASLQHASGGGHFPAASPASTAAGSLDSDAFTVPPAAHHQHHPSLLSAASTLDGAATTLSRYGTHGSVAQPARLVVHLELRDPAVAAADFARQAQLQHGGAVAGGSPRARLNAPLTLATGPATLPRSSREGPSVDLTALQAGQQQQPYRPPPQLHLSGAATGSDAAQVLPPTRIRSASHIGTTPVVGAAAATASTSSSSAGGSALPSTGGSGGSRPSILPDAYGVSVFTPPASSGTPQPSASSLSPPAAAPDAAVAGAVAPTVTAAQVSAGEAPLAAATAAAPPARPANPSPA